MGVEDDRLRRDIEDLFVRVRGLEGLDTPLTRALSSQVATLQAQILRINEEGATHTRGELRRLQDQIANVRESVEDVEKLVEAIQTEGKALRRAVLIAILAAALSLTGSLILRALGPG